MVKKIVVLIFFCSIPLLGQEKNIEEMVKTNFRAFKNYENSSYSISFNLTSFKRLKNNQLKEITHSSFRKKNYKENIDLSCFYFKVELDNLRQRNITDKDFLEYFNLPSRCVKNYVNKDNIKSFADFSDVYPLGYYCDKPTGFKLLFIRISNNLKNEFGRVDEHPSIQMLVIKNNVLTSWLTIANEDLEGYSYSKHLGDLSFKHFSQYVPYDDLGTPEMEKEAQKLRYSHFKINANGHVVNIPKPKNKLKQQ